MLPKVLRALRSIAAVAAGYAVIVVGTFLAFEKWLGGIGYFKSSTPVLAAASVAAFVSGLAGGYVAAWVGGRPHVLHAAGVILPLIVDTTYVVTSGKSSDPLWYDLVGAATLMVAAVLGGFLRRGGWSSRPIRNSLAGAVALVALVSCGGGGSDSPTGPPLGPTTQTFTGTTRATSPTSCSGDSHTFDTDAGPVSVTLVQSTDSLTLGSQVCAGNDDNNCTLNLMPLGVGQTRTGERRGGSSQTLKLLAPNCGGGGAVPAGPITYTVTVTYIPRR
jgi:hypothetical protein